MTDPGIDIMISPGLVNDGTKCRDGHVSRIFAQLLIFLLLHRFSYNI